MTERAGGVTPPPPRRADARRNRERLLAAAKVVFDEQGTDAPLDEIARRARVGNATMYRHFPTRRDFLVAAYADEVAELCARGEAALRDDPPGEALFGWIRAFIAHVAVKGELALAVPDDGGRRSELFDRWHDAMRSTASALLARAQQAGAVRAEVRAADLLALASGIALAGADARQIERLVALVRRGTDTPGAASSGAGGPGEE